MTRVLGSVLIVAAVVIGVVNNDSFKWGIDLPIVLAVVGVGLRIEAALGNRSGEPVRPRGKPC